jgi:UDP-2,3-diacylglucosamine pyrophosphatase LpxH
MSEETTPTPVILEQDLIYVISDLHLGDGTRSDVFSLGDSITKRDHMRSLIKEVKERDGHLLIVGDLLDLQQGWSIDRVVTANAILLRELSDLGAEGRLTYIWSELDEDLSYYQELLNITVAQEVHIPAPDHTPEAPHIWARAIQGHTLNPLIQSITDNPKRLRTLHHLTERLLGTWMRYPLENFPTLENKIHFWCLHKIDWLSRDWEESTGWKRTLHALVEQAYANQIGDASKVWSSLLHQIQETPENVPTVTLTGHSHVPGIVQIPNTDKTYVNTGSWTFNSHTVCKLQRQTGQVEMLDWASKEPITDEAYRHLLSDHPSDQAIQQGTFEHWWAQNYLGWLQFQQAGHTSNLDIEPTTDSQTSMS